MLNYFNHKHKNNLLSPSSLDANETTKRKASFGKLPWARKKPQEDGISQVASRKTHDHTDINSYLTGHRSWTRPLL